MNSPLTAHAYQLLPSGDDWRQALVLPTKGASGDGVALDERASRHLLWLELLDGTVWGLLFSGTDSFLSFHHISIIARRLEGTAAGDATRVIHHFAPLFGWRDCSSTGSLTGDLVAIAQEMARADLPGSPGGDLDSQPSPESVRELARPGLSLFLQGCQAFKAALDRETIDLLLNSIGEAPSFAAYNYLRHPLEKICRNRRQALQSYPLLGRLLVSIGGGHEVSRLQQVIDAGLPLPIAVSDYFRCSKRLARFLADKKFTEIGEGWRHDLRLLVEMLELIKPDRWPGNPGEWREFSRWLRPVYAVWRESRHPIPPQLMRNAFNELARGGYGNIARKLEINGVELTDLITINDFLRNYVEWAQQSGRSAGEAEQAMSHYSVLRLTLLSRRWHAWQARQLQVQEPGQEPGEEPDQEQGEEQGDDPEWLTLIDSDGEYHGQAVVPLNTAAKLRDEGQRLQHHAGCCLESCLYGGSQLFSIRDLASGSSLSTVELSIVAGTAEAGAEIGLRQHYGEKNSEPSEACQLTLAAFVSHLKEELHPERVAEIRLQLDERKRNAMRVPVASGVTSWPQCSIEEFSELLRGFPTLASVVDAGKPERPGKEPSGYRKKVPELR